MQIIRKEYLLHRTAYLFLLTFLYGWYRNHSYIVLFPVGSSAFTSINYWRNPVHCWRWYMDVFTVRSMTIYQLVISYNAEYSTPFYIVFCSGLLFYPVSKLLNYYNYYLLHIYAHMGLHIMLNIAGLILFSGEVIL